MVCIYNGVFCAEAADSRIIQEGNAGAKIGERISPKQNLSLLLNLKKNYLDSLGF